MHKTTHLLFLKQNKTSLLLSANILDGIQSQDIHKRERMPKSSLIGYFQKSWKPSNMGQYPQPFNIALKTILIHRLWAEKPPLCDFLSKIIWFSSTHQEPE